MSVKPVSLRGRQYWEVRVIRDGGAFDRRRYLDRKRFLKTEAKAVEAAMITEYEHTKEGIPKKHEHPATIGSASVESGPRPLPPTFAAFAERYLALQDRRRSDYRNKERELRAHLIPFFGEHRLDQIGRPEIDALRARLRAPTGGGASSRRALGRKEAPVSRRRKGRGKSPKTINNILGVLRSVLLLAVEYDVLDRPPRIKMEPVEKRDPAFLDFGEAAALVAATAPSWRALVLTALRTGLRQGELQELRWRDIALTGSRPCVRVSRSLRRGAGKEREVKTTKSAKPRSVPLAVDLLDVLRDHRRGAGEDALVFAEEEGGAFGGDRFRRVLALAAEEAGLRKHVHPHMLRHTFASHAMMRGVPVQVIQKWLGHAHVTTTERYAHLRPDTGDDLIDLLTPQPPADRAAEVGDDRGDNNGDDKRGTPSRVT